MASTIGDMEKGPSNPNQLIIDDAERIHAAEGTVRPLPATPTSLDDPPDGGFTAWSQVIVGHIAFLVSWAYGTSYAVFQLSKPTPTDRSGVMGRLNAALLVLPYGSDFRSPVRCLSDAGHTRLLFAVGSVLVTLGMFTTSLATQYWQILLSQGFCNGIGGGLMFMPAAATVATYFKRKRTMAMAINACGASTGAILYASITQNLTPKIGFPWAVRLNGFITIALCAVGFSLLRPRKIEKRQAPILDLGAFKHPPFVRFSVG
ncbi:Uu.00g037050.m01.CDS01 [Anthostomella pinea]|uniref:Uu.00g037050.m01.CDS01 n=1 Tax=Anthostomella pinea TaxID=933095 RepID=A0AAI8YDL9_9PEZI|nr:Uu.00g037050.m01.CDS01 [Anthostomella pinea]